MKKGKFTVKGIKDTQKYFFHLSSSQKQKNFFVINLHLKIAEMEIIGRYIGTVGK